MVKTRIIIFVLIAVAAISAAVVADMIINNNTYTFKKSYTLSNDIFVNPLMGFAPNANNKEKAESASLVYIDVTWRELEPFSGQYDFKSININNNIDKWRSMGKRAVLRFVCDIPGSTEHMDIPDWLYEETGDGVFYDISYGKGYAPDYNNEKFIEYHARAIKALGKEYASDDFIAYVELGSLGHWGEWHVSADGDLPDFPLEAVRRKYILPYLEMFSKARILMRRPFKACSQYSFGVYNDMTGHNKSTVEFLSWLDRGGVYSQTGESGALVPINSIWNKNPVGGEFTSSLTMESMLEDNIDTTLELIRRSHMTFIGPKSPMISDSGANAVLGAIGYRIAVTHSEISLNFFDTLDVTLYWKNNGAAPMYFDWPVFMYILDNNTDTVIVKLPVDIRLSNLTPDNPITTVTKKSLKNYGISTESFKNKDIKICIGIEDPSFNTPSVHLAMDADTINLMTVLY